MIKENIYYSKNVLDAARFRDLKDFCTNHCEEIPTYNFCRRQQESSNFIEEIIRHLIGRDHHVEYWVRDQIDSTLFHVDANELQAKIDTAKYGKEDPEMVVQFPLNTHILYVNIDEKMEGGELLLLPTEEYIIGRPILDERYRVREGSQMLVVEPRENHMVLFDKPIYHAITKVRNKSAKRRISLMFSSWGYVPDIYKDHEHWGNYSIGDINPTKWKIPQAEELELK
jgi:hypothetical protein